MLICPVEQLLGAGPQPWRQQQQPCSCSVPKVQHLIPPTCATLQVVICAGGEGLRTAWPVSGMSCPFVPAGRGRDSSPSLPIAWWLKRMRSGLEQSVSIRQIDSAAAASGSSLKGRPAGLHSCVKPTQRRACPEAATDHPDVSLKCTPLRCLALCLLAAAAVLWLSNHQDNQLPASQCNLPFLRTCLHSYTSSHAQHAATNNTASIAALHAAFPPPHESTVEH